MRMSFFVALISIATPSFAQSNLVINWEWKRVHQCSSTSPGIEVSGIPADTKAFSVSLVDHDARGFDHGGGHVMHDGSPNALIAEGALKNYRGPCPPNFQSFGHDYEFTVQAIAADGKTVLARGSKTKTFSASSVKQ